MLPRFEAGQFISFTYTPEPRPPAKGKLVQVGVDPKTNRPLVARQPPPPPPPPSNPHKEVFVLHPNWRNQLHAIDLSRMTPAESQVIHAFMDPKVKAAVDAGQWPVQGAPNYPLLRDILRRVDPTELIKNPMAFYSQLIKPFIRDKDCYRKYFVSRISNVRVVRESHVKGQVMNPAPLFKKI